VQENENARGADEPEERAEGRGPPEKGETDDKQTRVQGLLRHDVITHLQRLGSYEVTTIRTTSMRKDPFGYVRGNDVTYPTC
jgi:hypothetical protein